jgi:hypothetical protein
LVAGAAGIGIALILAGCAGRPPRDAVYRSGKGYRVALPPQDWYVVRDSRADLELRHREAPAGILVNASCDSRVAGRSAEALRREILAGFSDREVRAQGALSVSGREASHTVVDGRPGARDERVRVELLVLSGDRCVYDLAYAAPPADFARWQPDFQRLVGTFTLE